MGDENARPLTLEGKANRQSIQPNTSPLLVQSSQSIERNKRLPASFQGSVRISLIHTYLTGSNT